MEVSLPTLMTLHHTCHIHVIIAFENSKSNSCHTRYSCQTVLQVILRQAVHKYYLFQINKMLQILHEFDKQPYICRVKHFFLNLLIYYNLSSTFLLSRYVQKYSRLRCLLHVKALVICFYLGWFGSILQFRQNIIKVGSKSQVLTRSSNKL